MRARRGSAGFTLVETLASLTLLALLAVMLEAGLQFSRLKLARISGASAGQAIEAAQGALRERLTRSFPSAQFVTASPYVEFDGEPDHLDFKAPPPDAEAPNAVRHYDLGLAANGDLVLSSVSDLAADADAQREQSVLVRGATGLHLDYFGAAAPENQLSWRDTWRQQSTLPQLVRVRVEFAPGDQRVWPDMVVNVAATLDALCVIDPGTGGCKGRS
jgi:general secretion pathway protein J